MNIFLALNKNHRKYQFTYGIFRHVYYAVFNQCTKSMYNQCTNQCTKSVYNLRITDPELHLIAKSYQKVLRKFRKAEKDVKFLTD